ncbi:hypothetical protein LX36DRAFT_654622 [Colletotrichum falcatum]|nr:hypothetical protein LX36DRAFT_654622 [Colletotrichum falcatum]
MLPSHPILRSLQFRSPARPTIRLEHEKTACQNPSPSHPPDDWTSDRGHVKTCPMTARGD